MKGRLLLLFLTVKHDQSVRETYQTSTFVMFQEMKLVVRRPLPELLKHSSSYNDITLTDAREIDKVQGCDKLYVTFMNGITGIRQQSLIYSNLVL